MIPKIIHHVWIGDKIRPAVFDYRIIYPKWEVKTWATIEKPVTGNLISECPNVGLAADILRLEVLYRYGGLYVDIDVEPLQYPTWLDLFDCWAVKQFSGAGNCIMGAVPGAVPIKWALQTIIDNAERIRTLDRDLTMHVTGPDLISKTFGTCYAASLIELPLWSRYFNHHNFKSWRY